MMATPTRTIIRYPIPSRAKIVSICVAFNLVYEFSLRGPANILKPLALLLLLLSFYLALYSIYEDLIRRYRLHNYELALIAIAIGNVVQTFITGSMFQGSHLVLGINWGDAILEHAWGIVLQGFLTFYLATRLVARNWQERPMGRLGWVLSIGWIIVLFAGISRNPHFKHATLEGASTAIAISIVCFVLFVLSLKRARLKPWRNHPALALDLISFGSIVVFLCLGFIPSAGHTQFSANTTVNLVSLRLYILWSLVYTAVYALHRIISRREITI